MLHFGNNSNNCGSCVPFLGFRVIGIGLIGGLLGLIALQYVETPPSVILLSQSEIQSKNIVSIIEKLERMEENIIEIRDSLSAVKQQIGNETP